MDIHVYMDIHMHKHIHIHIHTHMYIYIKWHENCTNSNGEIRNRKRKATTKN